MRGRASALTLCLSATACTSAPTVAGGGTLSPGDVFPAPSAGMVGTTPATTDVVTPYRRFHQVVERALAMGDAAQVPDVATGAVAARIEDEVAADRRAGVVRRGHAVPHPHVAAVQSDSAQIVDCMTAAGPYVFRRDTGKRVGDAPAPRRYLAYATLTRADGRWKVAALTSPEDSRC